MSDHELLGRGHVVRRRWLREANIAVYCVGSLVWSAAQAAAHSETPKRAQSLGQSVPPHSQLDLNKPISDEPQLRIAWFSGRHGAAGGVEACRSGGGGEGGCVGRAGRSPSPPHTARVNREGTERGSTRGMSPIADGAMLSWQHYPTPHDTPVPTAAAGSPQRGPRGAGRRVYSSDRL